MQPTIELTATQQEQFEALWRDKVVPLAKMAPHIFSSPYYAHKGASEQVALTMVKEADQKAWAQYAGTRYRGMSNYSGD